MENIFRAVAERIPKMNDYLLRGFTRHEIDNSHKFVDVVNSEAVKLVSGAVEYLGYDILSPEDAVRFELNNQQGQKRARISLEASELRLVRYKFRHEGVYYEQHLYTPYVCHDMLIIRGKRYAIHRSIVEQVFSRVVNKNDDGIMVRPIRTRILFNRKILFDLKSVVTEEVDCQFIVTAGLHNKSHGRRSCDTNIILYLMAKFGFVNTLAKFGVSADHVKFVEFPDLTDVEEWDYFLAKKNTKYNNLHLKVHKSILATKFGRKLIANIVYTLTFFDIQTIDELYDPSGSIYRVMIGKIVYRDPNVAQARSNADTHIASVDTFLDPITRDRFNSFGVHVNDIYDLLVYVFTEIDRLMVNSSSRDLYTKRIDVTDGILVAAFATMIFRRFYRTNQRSQLRPREVKALLRPRPMAIDGASSSRKKSVRNISPSPQIFGDNWLVSCGLHKIRVGASADDRCHPSTGVFESIMAFVGSNPGQGGFFNPWAPITKDGAFIRPDYAEDVEEILRYLPD